MEKAEKKVTMKDIAQEFDVSIVTVSKALAGKDGVREQLRQEISRDYDHRAAAAYIHHRFVAEKCQVEVESIDGTFAGGTYIAHTPWKHIAAAYAMQALAAARKKGDISRRAMSETYLRTREILAHDLRSPAANESCYIPSDIELSRTGPYTFAAAHLILGLQALL